MKLCCTCKIEKPKVEFNKKSSMKDGLERYCKECHRKHNRKHYLDKAENYKATAKKWKLVKSEWWSNYKQSLQCIICGESRHWCLDFHHTDPSTKESNVSQMVVQNRSQEAILEEVSKCIVVCRNCHADIHYKQNITH